MILTNELKGIIVKQGYSQRQVANMIGITEKTFYEKMKKKNLCEFILCKAQEI